MISTGRLFPIPYGIDGTSAVQALQNNFPDLRVELRNMYVVIDCDDIHYTTSKEKLEKDFKEVVQEVRKTFNKG